jgi:hypothetical protein
MCRTAHAPPRRTFARPSRASGAQSFRQVAAVLPRRRPQSRSRPWPPRAPAWRAKLAACPVCLADVMVDQCDGRTRDVADDIFVAVIQQEIASEQCIACLAMQRSAPMTECCATEKADCALMPLKRATFESAFAISAKSISPRRHRREIEQGTIRLERRDVHAGRLPGFPTPLQHLVAHARKDPQLVEIIRKLLRAEFPLGPSKDRSRRAIASPRDEDGLGRCRVARQGGSFEAGCPALAIRSAIRSGRLASCLTDRALRVFRLPDGAR